MSNPYFNRSYFPENNEAKLYADGCNELIEIKGVDMFFLPRQRLKDDFIFGEDVINEFTKTHPLTFYIENFETFDGDGDIYSKFGFVPDYQISLIVGMQLFKGSTGLVAPLEGDLIYYPASGRLFEVVNHQDRLNYFMFNNREFCFKINCRYYEYSHETMDTNINEIDLLNQLTDIMKDDEKNALDDNADILNLTEADIFGNI